MIGWRGLKQCIHGGNPVDKQPPCFQLLYNAVFNVKTHNITGKFAVVQNGGIKMGLPLVNGIRLRNVPPARCLLHAVGIERYLVGTNILKFT
jgi:hypothetical protein